jgi:hypothetical protein
MREPDDLDRLLERWTERSRLTEAQSAAILAAVVRTPEPALDPAWWQDLVGRVSGVVVQVATLPDAARAAMLPPLPQLMTPASTR